jgi:homoserine O-acetyltransferase
MIEDWTRSGAIRPRAKRLATLSIVAVFAISLIAGVRPLILGIQAIILGCAHRPDAMALARRHIQREILRLVDDERGVALARSLAMTTYRSGAEFNARFGATGGGDGLLAYLDHHGRKFARRFDARSYTCLMDSIDGHEFAPARLVTPTTLLGFTTDELCPPDLVRSFAEALPRLRRLLLLDTPYGHDAFLCEAERIATCLHETLDGEES